MYYLPSNFLLIEMPGGGELIIILIVVLLLFGGKKIPELMRGLGKGIREFNNAKSSVTQELEEGMKETPRSANPSPGSSSAPTKSSNNGTTSNTVNSPD